MTDDMATADNTATADGTAVTGKTTMGRSETERETHSMLSPTAPADRRIDVLSLYPRDMNIYGDTGNITVILRRLELLGYEPVLHLYNQGDAWPDQVDLILGGGGQDSGQRKIQADFASRADILRDLAGKGVPMLLVCGLYQLFGRSFTTLEGDVLPGIGIFDAQTVGGTHRIIGNITEQSTDFGTIIGYENHSGKTTIDDGSATRPLGTVAEGCGNNGEDRSEGARVRNVIGTYCHGPLLPKNPRIADFLIRTAVINRYGSFTPTSTPEQKKELEQLDLYARRASAVAQNRPR